jgi:serine protease Do
VVCGRNVELKVVTGDGRTLLGKVEAEDEWLDWALVRVPGAGVATPLPLGDSTALQATDPVLIIGAPKGLAGTVHSGQVSFVGRNLHGVAFVQVNADVNPGNSGGPLLDGHGRVVGIVSLKITNADGMGMALPVEYVRPALADLPPPEATAAARFAELRRKVEAEDATEVARMRTDLAKPVLLDVGVAGPRALSLVVMQRWSGRPGTARVTVELHHDGQVLCRPSTYVSDWVDLQKKVKELSDAKAERQLTWLLRHDLLADVHFGGAVANLDRCPDAIPPDTRLKLEGAEGDGAWAKLPALGADRGQQAYRARLEQARRQADQRAEEREWRQAFAQAKARVRQLSERRDQLRREIVSPRDLNSYDAAQRNLPGVEQALRQAQEQLDDLERKASLQSVPRAWR